jgi:hypothetical protein
MKTKQFLLVIGVILSSTIAIAQNLHNAKVMGVLNLNGQDLAVILDVETEESYKTEVYVQGELEMGEEFQIDVINQEEAKVCKNDLAHQIKCVKQYQKKDLAYYSDKVNAKKLAELHNKYLTEAIDNYIVNEGISIEEAMVSVKTQGHGATKSIKANIVSSRAQVASDEKMVLSVLRSSKSRELYAQINDELNSSENYFSLESNLYILLNDVNASITSKEEKAVLSVYIETLVHSGEIWYSENKGGLGTGRMYLIASGAIGNDDDVPGVPEWVRKDGMGAAGGFIKFAVFAGFGGPGGAGVLLGVVAFSAAWSSISG